MMRWFQRFYNGLRQGLSERKRRIFIGTQHLELIAAIDRKLARLIRQRDRELGVLAQCFLNADEDVRLSDPFRELLREIERLESERSKPIENSSSSLTSLVIPDSDHTEAANVSDMELIDPSERDDLYRRRLRGLYMDLGELVLSHEVSSIFPEQVSCVSEIRSQISLARQEREEHMALLPSSKRVLNWIKLGVVSVLGFVILTAIF